MSLADPLEFLLALEPFLGEQGDIRNKDDVSKIIGFMEKAENLVGRCVYVNVLQATESEAVLEQFISAGGWDLLNTWLQEAKTDDNQPFLLHLLNLYANMPVSVSILKSNNCAKTIKALAKNEKSDLKCLSGEIVDKWMTRIRESRDAALAEEKKQQGEKSAETSKDKEKSKSKLKKKEKHSDKSKEKKTSPKGSKKFKRLLAEEEDSEEESPKAKRKAKRESASVKEPGLFDQEEREAIVIRVSKLGGVTKVTRPKDISPKARKPDAKPEAPKRPHPDSLNSSGANLKNVKIPKLSSKLANGVDNKERSVEEKRPNVLEKIEKKERPKTVKMYNSKFRSTGLEETVPPPSKKKLEEEKKKKLEDKAKSTTILGSKKLSHSIPDEKEKTKPSTSAPRRLSSSDQKSPVGGASGSAASQKSTISASPSSSGASSPVAAASDKKSPRTPLTIAAPPSGQARSNSIDSNSSMSPSDTVKKPLPVKRAPSHEMHESTSFMDALIAPTQVPVKKKRKLVPKSSPVHGAKSASTGAKDASQSVPSYYKDTLETDEAKNKDKSGDDGGNSTDSSATIENTSPVTDESNKNNGKKKKKVTWVDEVKTGRGDLRQFHYFELDETERVNVNRVRGEMGDMKKADMLMDREAMACAKRLSRDKMQEAMEWRRPIRLRLAPTTFVSGERSQERDVQNKRELAVLLAIYFHKHMIPDSPAEPTDNMAIDLMSNPRIIPTDEQYAGNNSDAVQPNVLLTPVQADHVASPAHMTPTTIVPGQGLPPDVASLLSQLAAQTSGARGLHGGEAPAPAAQIANLLASVTGNSAAGNNPHGRGSPSQQPQFAQQSAGGGASMDNPNSIVGSIQNLLNNYQQNETSDAGDGNDQLTEQLKHILQSTLMGQGSQNNIMGGPMLGPSGPDGMGPMMGPPGPDGMPMMPMPPFPPGHPMFRGPMPPMGYGPMGPGPGPEQDGFGPGPMGRGPDWRPPMRGGMYGDDRGPRWRGGGGGLRGYHGGGGGGRGGGERRGRGGRGEHRRQMCWHFSHGKGCSYGTGCQFLHPGVNGPL